MQNQIILTIGISNCGKTTWATEFVEENPNFVNLNRDDCRASLHTSTNNIADYKFSRAKESEVTTFTVECCEVFAESGRDIIISDTNLNPKTRDMWKQWATDNEYKYVEKVFDVEPHICKDRNIKRGYSVPPHVIDNQYKQFRTFMGFTSYVGNKDLTSAVIFDIDGTLACMLNHRRPFEWKKCINDSPRHDIIELLKMYSINHKIIIMSGRDSICRAETITWLERYDIQYTSLLMRTAGDSRSDPIIKEEMFNNMVAPYYNIKLVVDDRQRMVNHWRNMGVQCIQVQNGDF